MLMLRFSLVPTNPAPCSHLHRQMQTSSALINIAAANTTPDKYNKGLLAVRSLGRTTPEIKIQGRRGFSSLDLKSTISAMFRTPEPLDREEKRRRKNFVKEFYEIHQNFKRAFASDPTMSRETAKAHRKQLIQDFNAANAHRGYRIVSTDNWLARLIDVENSENTRRDVFIMIAFFITMLGLLSEKNKEMLPEVMYGDIIREEKPITLEDLLEKYVGTKLISEIAYYPEKNMAVIVMDQGAIASNLTRSTFVKLSEEFENSSELFSKRIREVEKQKGVKSHEGVDITTHLMPVHIYTACLNVYVMFIFYMVFTLLWRKPFRAVPIVRQEVEGLMMRGGGGDKSKPPFASTPGGQ